MTATLKARAEAAAREWCTCASDYKWINRVDPHCGCDVWSEAMEKFAEQHAAELQRQLDALTRNRDRRREITRKLRARVSERDIEIERLKEAVARAKDLELKMIRGWREQVEGCWRVMREVAAELSAIGWDNLAASLEQAAAGQAPEASAARGEPEQCTCSQNGTCVFCCWGPCVECGKDPCGCPDDSCRCGYGCSAGCGCRFDDKPEAKPPEPEPQPERIRGVPAFHHPDDCYMCSGSGIMSTSQDDRGRTTQHVCNCDCHADPRKLIQERDAARAEAERHKREADSLRAAIVELRRSYDEIDRRVRHVFEVCGVKP